MAVSSRTVKRTAVVAVVLAAFGTIAALTTSASGADKADPSHAAVLKQEQLIAECMRGRGFDYVATMPKDVVMEDALRAAVREGRDVGEALRQAQARMPEDPNKKLVGSLPPQRQQLWGDALWGNGTTVGCFSETFSSAWGVDLDQAVIEGEQTVARVKVDPAVVAAERVYAGCMTGHGYPVTTTDDIHGVVGRQAENLDATGAEDLSTRAYAAHNACFAPYREVFNRVHRRLGAAG